MIYLASPYTAKSKELQEANYQSVLRFTGRLLAKRHKVWSPVVHCHVLALLYDLPTDHLFWKELNHDFIRRCDELWVAKIGGWEYSLGIEDEVNFANMISIPVKYVGESDL